MDPFHSKQYSWIPELFSVVSAVVSNGWRRWLSSRSDSRGKLSQPQLAQTTETLKAEFKVEVPQKGLGSRV